MSDAVAHVGGLLGYLAAGAALRFARILKAEDGTTMLSVAMTVGVPALLLLQLTNVKALWASDLAYVPIISVLHAGLMFLSAWLVYRSWPARGRALMMGSTVGLELILYGFPFAEALWGPAGLRLAILFNLVNLVTVYVLSNALFATAPGRGGLQANFAHADGGSYAGEWEADMKEGYGVYTHTGGARYEGTWQNNVKHGYGVYHYAKGGTYVGQWSNGRPEGRGARTLKDGRQKTGVWAEGKLVEPLQPGECEAAAQAAASAATAAQEIALDAMIPTQRRVSMALALSPPLMAVVVAGIVVGTGSAVPPQVQELLAPVAGAAGPITLLGLGATLPLELSQQRRRQLVALLGLRFTAALLAAAVAAAVLGLCGAPRSTAAALVALMLMPLAPATVHFAATCRGDAALVGVAVAASVPISAGLAATVLAAEPALPMPQASLPALCLALAAGCMLASSALSQSLRPMRMRYTGPLSKDPRTAGSLPTTSAHAQRPCELPGTLPSDPSSARRCRFRSLPRRMPDLLHMAGTWGRGLRSLQSVNGRRSFPHSNALDKRRAFAGATARVQSPPVLKILTGGKSLGALSLDTVKIRVKIHAQCQLSWFR